MHYACSINRVNMNTASPLPEVVTPPSNQQPKSQPWHTLPIDRTLSLLNTRDSGLNRDEAARRLSEHGPNELQAAETTPAWRTLMEQFKNVLVLMLLAAAVVSGALGHGLEATAIAVIVLFAVVLGFVQEYRAERALAALRQMAAPMAHVMRDGAEVSIPAREVVPGDIVRLTAGDRVPADLRITSAINLAVDEAALTGESLPVHKDSAPLADEGLGIGDRHNMAFAGTVVTYGRGQGVVVGTGMATEFGRISEMLHSVDIGRTPLQENLQRVGRTLGQAAVVVILLVVGLGLWRGEPWLEMLIFGIALAVAVVPEALPAVVTISLAIGVRRMVKRNALVRRLPVVETLGSTSVICSDKTGTLTRNEMTVRRVFAAGASIDVSGSGYEPQGGFTNVDGNEVPQDVLTALLRAGALASDATVQQKDGRWSVTGDPTEAALIVAAQKAGLDLAALSSDLPRTDEIPFSSERRRMTTLHSDTVAFSKGSADVILDSCAHVMTSGGEEPLDAGERDRLREIEQQLAREGLRVLAIAEKRTASLGDAERDMTLLGLVGLMDPPREEAAAAVETCRRAGVTPVMITGDHPVTAATIARELGILEQGRAITGRELEAMSDEDLAAQIQDIRVYARVSPADKLRVISAWQQRRDVVAMTGDGVNDAPALKKADVGIAMGIAGTDVSKEAAAITLLDDNFASIVAAVEEGRIVFSNIRKYLTYLLSSNVGEVLLMAGAVVAGLPLPLTAVQILYVNLATDGLPALALAVDPPEDDLMQRRPRDPRAGIFTRPLVVLLLTGGFWSAVVNLSLFTWLLNSGRPVGEAVAMTFVSLVLIQFFKAYNYRSDRLSILRRPFANKWLNLAVGWELILLAFIVYVPLLQLPFETFPLSAGDWLLVTGLAITVVPVLEAVKWAERRGWFGELT